MSYFKSRFPAMGDTAGLVNPVVLEGTLKTLPAGFIPTPGGVWGGPYKKPVPSHRFHLAARTVCIKRRNSSAREHSFH